MAQLKNNEVSSKSGVEKLDYQLYRTIDSKESKKETPMPNS